MAHSVWEKYDCHPEIGPLIEEYRDSVRTIEYLKRDLRTNGNIDDIVQMSYGQAELKRQITGLVDQEEAELFERRKDSAWLALTVIAVLVGVANVVLGFGLSGGF